jgi:acyl-CoA thioesterase I
VPKLSQTTCFAALLVTALAWSSVADAAKVACVGDSITYGYGLSDASTQSYPAVLGTKLGSAHEVQNFGVSGATLLKNGDKPYWDEARYTASGSFDPDVVVVMLGTNDSKPQNWSHESEFASDYLELIEHYRALGALVYLATPPPVYGAGAFDIPPDVVADEVVPLVRTIADDASAPLIDVFTALSGHGEDFPDTVHPNAAGAVLIADAVAAALEENGFGGAGMTAGAGGGGGAAQGGRSNVGGGGSGDAGGAGGAGASSGGMAGQGAGDPSGGAPSSAGQGVAAGAGGTLGGGPAGTSGSSPGGQASALGGRSAAGSSSVGAGGVASGSGGAPSAGGTPGSAGQSSGAGGMAAQASGAPEESGCGCRVSRSSAPALPGWWWSLVLAAAAVARRRSKA